MKKSSIIALSVAGGCFATLTITLVIIGLIFAGGVYLWEKTLIDEPLTEAENAKVTEISRALEKFAGDEAIISVTTRNMMHSDPELTVKLTASYPVAEDRGRTLIKGVDNELRSLMPKDWELKYQHYEFEKFAGQKVSVYSRGLLPSGVDRHVDLALAAPEKTDWAQVQADTHEVEWRKFEDSSCIDYFNSSKAAIESSSALDGSGTLTIELGKCEGTRALGNFRYAITARPEEVPLAVSWLEELQPQLAGKGINGVRVLGNGDIVLLPENFRDTKAEQPKPEQFKNIWPHGKITIASDNTI